MIWYQVRYLSEGRLYSERYNSLWFALIRFNSLGLSQDKCGLFLVQPNNTYGDLYSSIGTCIFK